MKQIALRLDDEMAEAIETARGKTPRERWIKQALATALSGPPSGAREAASPRASAAPNYAMEHQQRLNDAKYGRRS